MAAKVAYHYTNSSALRRPRRAYRLSGISAPLDCTLPRPNTEQCLQPTGMLSRGDRDANSPRLLREQEIYEALSERRVAQERDRRSARMITGS